MVVGTGPSEQTRAVSLRDRTQSPDLLIEAAGFGEIGGNELDAAYAADETFRQGRHRASIPFTNPDALPKSILPA